MKKLSRSEILEILSLWYGAWNKHDLNGVLGLFHEEAVFINWNGHKIVGKNNLERAWRLWFLNDEIFTFIEEETFFDEIDQKAAFRWILDWPSKMPGRKGREVREGVDILHFCDGLIINKLTYSKTI